MSTAPPAASEVNTIHSIASAAPSAAHRTANASMVTPGWFESGSLSFELVKGVPAAFVALVVGLIAAFIAWRPYQVAASTES